MPPPPRPLYEELAERILVHHLPPDDPATLLRAALVCKRWARVVSGPGFRARFLEIHGAAAAPILGFLDLMANCDGAISRYAYFRPPPPLPAELIEEIVVRLPPEDPATLLRAALVCKLWRRLVFGPGFRTRFSEFHSAASPPMLCCFCDLLGGAGTAASQVVPTSPFRPRGADLSACRTVDSHHGRVLLLFSLGSTLSVWNPMTGEQHQLPKPPRYPLGWSAAVFCAAEGTCNHIACHPGPFRVVFVGTEMESIFCYVYSSADGVWKETVSVEHPRPPACLETGPGVVVGSSIYFLFQVTAAILRCDMDSREVSVIDRPPTCTTFRGRAVLMIMGDGRLGFAYVQRSTLFLCEREVGASGERWVGKNAIELRMLLPADALLTLPQLIGFAYGGVFFVWTSSRGLFMIDMESGQVKNIDVVSGIWRIIPYLSYYLPAPVAVSTRDEGSSAGVSTALGTHISAARRRGFPRPTRQRPSATGR